MGGGTGEQEGMGDAEERRGTGRGETYDVQEGHGDRSFQRRFILIGAGGIIGHERGFNGQTSDGQEGAEGDHLVSRQEVDDENGHDSGAQRQGDVARLIQEGLGDAEAETLVDDGAVVVDDEHAGELDAAGQTDGVEGPLSVGWLGDHGHPAVWQMLVQADLGIDLAILDGGLVGGMEPVQDASSLFVLPVLDEPSGRLWQPVHGAEDDEGWDTLKTQRGSPLVVGGGVIMVEAKAGPGGEEVPG